MEERDWDTLDGDSNGYADDYRGWNFDEDSPNIITNGSEGAHGAYIMQAALTALNASGTDGDRVRIMHVIGTGAEITQYVLDHKAAGVNIIAVSNSIQYGEHFSRDDAEALGQENILLFVASHNNNANQDVYTDGTGSFYDATPRRGTQAPPVQTILPVTTSSSNTDYGINSFYFAAGGVFEQSYATPIAAVHAAIAAQAYQDAHSGATPSAMQIKRAMMSGVTYADGLTGRTITHDYVSSAREDGGVLSRSAVVAAINDTVAGLSGVLLDATGEDSVGTTVNFDILGSAEPDNWTISWGDNSGADASGVQVRPGSDDLVSHRFPLENLPHDYYPTIYAMVGAGNGRRVYLQSAEIEVTVESVFASTSGADEYLLERDNNGKTKLTLVGTASHSFASGELPDLILTLGEDDKLTIDFNNGNMLANTALKVVGDGMAEGVSIVGTGGGDTLERGSISGTEEAFSVESASISAAFSVDARLDVTLNGAGGNDVLSALSSLPCTLIGGSDSDLASVVGSRDPDTFNLLSSEISVVRALESFPFPVSGIESMSVNGRDEDDTFIVAGNLALPVTVNGGDGSDTVVIDGTSSADTITFGSSTLTLGSTVITPTNTESRQANGNGNADTINLSAFSGGATAFGNAGNDTITGGSGDDSINGGDDNDVLVSGAGEDSLVGGSGTDTADYSSRGDDLSLSLDDASNDGASGESGNLHSDIESILSGSGNDQITGAAGIQTIRGAAGSDVICAGDGNDCVFGDGGDDSLYGEDGGDTITGGADIDSVIGGNGDDLLWCIDNESDYVNGGAGTDTAHIDEPWEYNGDDVEFIEVYGY